MSELFKKCLWVALLLGMTATAMPAQNGEVIFERAVGGDTLTVSLQRDTTLILRQHPVHGFALRNNVAYDATGTPNLGFEIPLGDHASLGGSFGFKWWDRILFWDKDTENPSKWRNLVIEPEFRYYLDYIGNGHFFGADLMYMHYNAGALRFPLNIYRDLQEHRLQGNFYGLGLFYGYSWWIGRRWRFEAEVGLSGGWRSERVFECVWCGKELGPNRGVTLLPKVGLNFVYTLGKTAKQE